MKAKLFLLGAAALLCSLLATSCEQSDFSGESEVIIGGGDSESWDQVTAEIARLGETGIEGLYATKITMWLMKSADDNASMVVRFTMFHSSPELTAGNYTFPSTGPGTVDGSIDYVSKINSGTMSIAISGKKYTINVRNAEYRDDDTGEMDPSTEEPPQEPVVPQFTGSSTIVDEVSGRTVPNLNMSIEDGGVTPVTGLKRTIVSLYAYDTPGGWNHYYTFVFYSEGNGLTPGTYSVPGTGAGSCDGNVDYIKDSTADTSEFLSGEVVVSESGGVYTLRLNDVIAGGREEQNRLKILNGTFIGMCSEYRELNPGWVPQDTTYTGTGDFDLGEGMPRFGAVSATFNAEKTAVYMWSYVLPVTGYNYSRSNQTDFSFELSTPFAPGIYSHDSASAENSLTYVSGRVPLFDADGTVVSTVEFRLTKATLEVRHDETTGVWELELSDTETDSETFPTFDGVYTGRIDQ